MTTGHKTGRCESDHYVLADDNAMNVLFDSP